MKISNKFRNNIILLILIISYGVGRWILKEEVNNDFWIFIVLFNIAGIINNKE